MNAHRLPWLLVALAATAVWAALGESPQDAVTPLRLAGEPLPKIRALLARSFPEVPATDIFGLPMPPSPPPPAAAVPPTPTFPAPLAWRCIGKQHEGNDGWSVFLAKGKQTRVVRVGDTLDAAYHVAAITPPTLTLLHLKTRTHHTLDIGVTRE